MKKFKIIILAASLGITSACNTDRLPEDSITPHNFWTKEQDARLALNSAYTYLSSLAENGWYRDSFADNSYAQYPWESVATLVSAGDITAATNFGYDYGYIRNANMLLTNIDRVQMDEKLKNRYKAEARVLRAMNYFHLAQLFGPVPLIEKSEVDENVAPKPEAEIYAFVKKELTESIAELPVSYSGGTSNEKGRITKGAALAFKARVDLYTGAYADAAAAAKQVMDLGAYKLFTTEPTALDYADKWENGFMTFSSDAEKLKFYRGLASYQAQFWEANDSNAEVILSNQYLKDQRASGIFTLLMPNEFAGWSSITPTIEMVNAYWTKDGTAFTPPSNAARASYYNKGTVKPEYLDEFKNRDTRLYASIMFPKSPWNNLKANYIFNWPKGANNTSRTGYNYKKLVDPKSGATQWNAGNDTQIIRYAEVLLTYAEAKNELSGPDASIYDALDQIRTRVGMLAVSRTHTQSSLRELIRNERRIELANEGQRYFDIKRWKIAPNVMKTIYDITDAKVQDRVWDNKFYKLPYPQTSVDRNPLLKPAQTEKGY